jgi:ankyrin repeat protein
MLNAKGGALADLCRSPSKIGMTPCIAAAAGGHAAVLEILLSRRAAEKDPEAFCPLSASDDKGNNALHHAAMSGSEAAAKLLCSCVAPPPWTANRSGKTPLQVGLLNSIVPRWCLEQHVVPRPVFPNAHSLSRQTSWWWAYPSARPFCCA